MLFPTLAFGIFFLVVFAVAWELSAWPESDPLDMRMSSTSMSCFWRNGIA